MQSLFESLQGTDEAVRTVIGAVVIFAALTLLGVLAERVDKQRADKQRNWFTEKQNPPPATTENFSTGKVGGWIMVVFFVVLAVAIYALAGEIVAAMFRTTLGEMM